MFYTGHDLKRSYRLCGLLPAKQHDVCKKGALGEALAVPSGLIILGPRSWLGIAVANLIAIAGIIVLVARRSSARYAADGPPGAPGAPRTPRWLTARLGAGMVVTGITLLTFVLLWDLWH